MGGLSSLIGNFTGGFIGESDAEVAAAQSNLISEKAKNETLAELGSTWDDIQSYLQPYIQSGERALSDYRSAIGAAPDAPVFTNFNFDPSNIENNPAYQFVKQQGLQAINRSAAANRALTSGNRGTALADYASGLASQEYGNEFQRQLQTYGANQNATAMNFNAQNQLYNQNMGYLGNLVTSGENATTNQAGLRQWLGGARSSAISNRAAEATAATLIPAQEKMSFVNNIISGGAQAIGAAYGAKSNG